MSKKREFLAILAVAVCLTFVAQAATPEEIQAAIDLGITWLVEQQQEDGGWGGGCAQIAYTGFAVLKLETHAIEQGLSPVDPAYEYADEVQAGLDFIVAHSSVQAIGVEPAGNPDGDGDGIGVFLTDECNWHPMYNTSVGLMALSASGDPSKQELIQDVVDFLAWAQVDPDCGIHRGGWRYAPDQCDSDNSNSGWVSLGLGYAQSEPPYGFEITVPLFVKNEFKIWLDVIQDPVNGDPDDGGSWYDPYSPWVNILKTGNLLQEFALVGYNGSEQRVKDAVDYIERHWFDVGFCEVGWMDHRQAMFTMMKGLVAQRIDLLDLDGNSVPETDWFDQVSTHLVATQLLDGRWPEDCWGDGVLSTAWALLTLEKAVPPSKPTCPKDASLDLEKYVNGDDADVAPGVSIPVGSPVHFDFVVKNDGLCPLFGLMVADNTLGIVCKKSQIDPGETMICTVEREATEGPHKNRAKAGAGCIDEAGKKFSVGDVDLGHYVGVLDDD